MKYVFFDIECSNGHDICSFSYCLTDKKFKILKKEDLVINPESKIKLSSNKGRPKIQLAYSQEYFLKQNPFNYFYPTIKSLLTNPKHILFGHSISSDFGFLNIACNRYNLPLLDIAGFDTQKLYCKIYNKPHVQSLEQIITELEIDKIFQYHKSSEDAQATMMVFKSIIEENNLSLEDLKSLYFDCYIQNNKNNNNRYLLFVKQVKELREKYNNLNKKIAFCDKFKNLTNEKKLEIIELLFKNGYDYTNKIYNCDIFVYEESKGKRYDYYNYLLSKGKNIEALNKVQFFEKLKKYDKNIDLNRKMNQLKQEKISNKKRVTAKL